MMAKSDNGELNRSVTAENTSDPNNSLLQKVTKRVSGLIPTSFTKWFGQPGDGQQSVIRRRESVDDDDDDNETTQIQPPKKRAKLPTTAATTSDVDYAATVNNFALTTSTPLVTSRTNDLRHHLHQPGPSGYVRHLSAVSTSSAAAAATSSQSYEVRNSRNEAATVTNGDDKSDSGDSTSGYSSVPAQQHKESSFNSDRINMAAQPSTAKTSPSKSLNATFNSSRSLFSEQSLNPKRACLSARRPTFSASTFGSPSFVDRTLSTKRAVNSPFYGGRTIYGGASAYRKRSRIIFPRDETNNVTVKNSVEIKPVNSEPSSSASSVNLSKTARRILDTLEHFSSPVLDAKKIPAVKRTVGDVTKPVVVRKTPYSRATAPNKELLVPSVPDLLKMKLKSRLQDSTVQVRKVATTSTSVLNSSEYSIRTVEDTSKPAKHSSKMKTKVVSVRESKTDWNYVVDAVKLPEVQLPITNLPKFDFSLPPPPKPVTKSLDKLPVILVSKPVEPVKPTVQSVSKPKARKVEFTFANPIVVVQQHAPKSVVPVKQYKFSEPLDAKQVQPTASVAAEAVPTFTYKVSQTSTAPRRKDTSKNNGQNANVPFSLPLSFPFSSGSVLDILRKMDKPVPKPTPSSEKPSGAPGRSAKTPSAAGSLMDKFKPATGTWECSACMVRNLPTATRCLACETLKEPPKKLDPPVPGFGGQFKMATDKWECGACMVRNSNTDNACVACTTPKPGAAAASAKSAASAPAFSGFGMQFKPAEGTWECGACMVRNKGGVTKCVACETAKPAGNKADGKPASVMRVETKATASGFGDFIKKQQSNWECQSCMVRNPPEKTQCMCCDTPKPGEQPEPAAKPSGLQFKFGIDKAATNASPTGFKFGIDKSTEAKPATTFSFGIKPVEKTTISSNVTTTPALTGFTFGVPVAAKPSDVKPENKISVPSATALCTAPVVAKVSTTSTMASEAPKTFTFSSVAATTTANRAAKSMPTAATTQTFSFGTISTASTTQSSTLPTFSFAVTTTAAAATSPSAVTLTTANTASSFTVPSASIFGASTSAPVTTATVPASTTAFGSISKAAVAVTTAATTSVTAVTSSTFSFGSATSSSTVKPVSFGSENSLPLPQFNFGTARLPFSPAVTATVTSTQAVPTSTTSVSFPAGTAAAFAVNNQSFTFNTVAPNVTVTNNNNKAEIKPFGFGGGSEPAAKTPTFTFAPHEAAKAATTTAATVPLAKAAPMFNFGAPTNTKPGTGFSTNATQPQAANSGGAAGIFGFNAAAVRRTQGPPPAWGMAPGAAAVPQNGGFNFGVAPSTGPSFNFSATVASNQTASPGVFGFGGSSQAGSGSASSAGVFAFGGGSGGGAGGGVAPSAPQQQPQQAPAFTPDIKPNFNFTSGAIPNFTAQEPSAAPGAITQRKIRKAVRRTQQR